MPNQVLICKISSPISKLAVVLNTVQNLVGARLQKLQAKTIYNTRPDMKMDNKRSVLWFFLVIIETKDMKFRVGCQFRSCIICSLNPSRESIQHEAIRKCKYLCRNFTVPELVKDQLSQLVRIYKQLLILSIREGYFTKKLEEGST